MKKFWAYINLSVILFFLFTIKNIYACSIPPDILSRYYIYEDKGKIKVEYSLYTWDKFKIQIEKYFKQKTKKDLNEKNIKVFIDNFIKNSSSINYNGVPLELKYESVKFFEKLENGNPFIEIKFSTQLNGLKEKNDFYLIYKKNIFSDLTNLVHAYLYSDIEENLNIDGFTMFGEKRYDNYFFKNWKYGIYSQLIKEEDDLVEYSLNINKIEEIEKNQDQDQDKKKDDNPLLNVNNKNNLEVNGVRVGKYFESFLKDDIGIFMQIFGIIFAIVFGALHAILPGHAKSIVGAYNMENKSSSSRKKETIILIISITLSHTFFIFLLAVLINLLNYGVGTGTSYISKFSSVLYILFGIYFSYYAIRKIIHTKKHNSSCCCHKHGTSGKENKNGFKKALFAGIIFGCNPCIDALVLFIFSFSIGNVFYASLIVLSFSLGLGLMLGLLAYLVGKGYNFLSSKRNNKIQNILDIFILILGIFIIFIGINGII
ncbi:hypothetical protein DLH72_00315 [Candidatus Gracilibacteria bacterium]|nr:MAG: hypothetical protein DLH72_00315 [Candidatus Gracilibacteria bacterium]